MFISQHYEHVSIKKEERRGVIICLTLVVYDLIYPKRIKECESERQESERQEATHNSKKDEGCY
jgi:hypothetical protein